MEWKVEGLEDKTCKTLIDSSVIILLQETNCSTAIPVWKKYICKIYVKVNKIYFFQKLYMSHIYFISVGV